MGLFAVPAHQDSVFQLNWAIHDAVRAGYRDDCSIPIVLGYINEIHKFRRHASAARYPSVSGP